MSTVTVKVIPDLSAFRSAEQHEVADAIRSYFGPGTIIADEDVYGLADMLLEKFTILPL